ncbi:MAG: inositol monophosphatase [Armatimonadetes bacterium]|nr:inositol monophosphatase [Armatimonadota bacterium]
MQLEDFIQDVARGAGGIIREKYQKLDTWRAKGSRGDVVTEVDEASEKYVIDRIKAEFPDDGIISEETGAQGNLDGAVWVIDPLDGTKNYTMHIPMFAVSIGRAEGGVPSAGGIYDPIHDEMFYAERGRGASVNGRAIQVAEEKSLDDCLINVSWSPGTDSADFIRYTEYLSHRTTYFRRFGSAAVVMAYIACGRLHGYLQAGLNPWDVAAGIVIIQEAGGVITDFKGKPIDLRDNVIHVVTANPEIHAELLYDVIGIYRHGSEA